MISIIVPLFNEGSNVVDLVEHLSNLKFHFDSRDDEIEVILADASTDASSAHWITKALKPSQEKGSNNKCNLVWHRCDNASRAMQMNAGAKISVGTLLVFLHCDSRLPVSAITLLNEVAKEKDVWGRFDLQLLASGWIYRVIERMINLRSAVSGISTGDQALFVDRKLFFAMDGYTEQPLMEDIDLCKRLKQRSRPHRIRDAVKTSARRWQTKGIPQTVWLMWRLRCLYWLGVPAEKLVASYENVR